jgi:hypothetical protein
MIYREAMGLVFVALRKPAEDKPATVLNRMRYSKNDPPPYGAAWWRITGGKWSKDFGGRWLEKGDGTLIWEWN